MSFIGTWQSLSGINACFLRRSKFLDCLELERFDFPALLSKIGFIV
jgi:hypothetical protein